MKIRNGFVSNSSSSSFIVFKGEKTYIPSIVSADGENEFGWDFNKYRDFESKLIFAGLQIRYNPMKWLYGDDLEVFKNFKEFIKSIDKFIYNSKTDKVLSTMFRDSSEYLKFRLGTIREFIEKIYDDFSEKAVNNFLNEVSDRYNIEYENREAIVEAIFDGYIDHQSVDEGFSESKKLIWKFLEEGELYTGNDNDDEPASFTEIKSKYEFTELKE